MAESNEDAVRRILHVHPPSLAEFQQMADAIAEAGCQPAPCPDVYRALARLGGRGQPRFCAVIVSVDRLETPEFEFFPIAARHHRDVPVYVCGGPQAKAKIETALRVGARREVDAESVLELLEPVSTELESAALPDASDNHAESRPAATPPASNAKEETEAETDLAESEPEPSRKPKAKTHRGPTVRVPWLRYEDGPQRTPPAKIESSPPQPEPEPEPASSGPEAPLLTPEELQALMANEDEDQPATKRTTRRGS